MVQIINKFLSLKQKVHKVNFCKQKFKFSQYIYTQVLSLPNCYFGEGISGQKYFFLVLFRGGLAPSSQTICSLLRTPWLAKSSHKNGFSVFQWTQYLLQFKAPRPSAKQHLAHKAYMCHSKQISLSISNTQETNANVLQSVVMPGVITPFLNHLIEPTEFFLFPFSGFWLQFVWTWHFTILLSR